MKSYYVMFYNGDKKVCGTRKRANSKEEACMMAEFALRKELELMKIWLVI